jgi:hypothetical protein
MPDKFQKKQQCPHCEEFVMFNEIHTRTYKDTNEGKKKVSVTVLRCPECKRIAGPSKPLDQ